jgi:hypothetical protein
MASRLQGITSSEQESEYDDSASQIEDDDDECLIAPEDQDPSSTTIGRTITGNAESTPYQARLANILRGIVSSARQTAFEARPKSAFFWEMCYMPPLMTGMLSVRRGLSG